MSERRPGLLEELKRRRVLRAALLYVVAAWAVIQAADVIFPHLGLPDWSVRLVIAVAALGFPLALVLAWAFDLKPGGIERGPSPPPSGSDGSTAGPSRLVYAGVVTVLLSAGLVLTLAGGRAGGGSSMPVPEAASVAVLPFVNMSASAENEYFSDGLTEELLNALAKVEGLHVASRTSSFAFKGRNEDVSEIARQLRVRAILEGSVRRSESALRITAQLIDAETGYHMWSETYDRHMTDVFAIQEEIARSIAQTLKGTLLGKDSAALARQPTRSVEAYDLYLRARYGLTQGEGEDAVRSAIADLDRALALDPMFALAHAGLARAYIYLAEFVQPSEVLPRAKASALKALELDSSLVETRLSLAQVRLRYDWDWAAAEREILRAITLGPGEPQPLYAYADFLQISRRFEDAGRMLEQALRADSLRATDPEAFQRSARTRRAGQAAVSGDYPTAIRLHQEAVAAQPEAYSRHWLLGLTYIGAGQHDSAVAALEHADSLFDGTYPLRTHLGIAYAGAGRNAEAERILQDLLSYTEENYVGKDQVAALYLALGDTARALDWMERAFDEQHWWLPSTNISPFFEPLRTHPRFRALLQRMNAPGL